MDMASPLSPPSPLVIATTKLNFDLSICKTLKTALCTMLYINYPQNTQPLDVANLYCKDMVFIIKVIDA
jgi:hypothetical protein